ncbi:MAG: type 1 glutamine amidotransferase [Desulfobacterales bacterium]|nr:type 1 glutamine amidotransferase [Desulfobacterales bacterium]
MMKTKYLYFSIIMITLLSGFFTITLASELKVTESFKAKPLVPIINTAYLLDNNPSLKAFLMAKVKKSEMIKGKRIAILATDGVEELELTSFLNYLKARGGIVEVISTKYSPWPDQYGVQYPVSRREYIQTVRFMHNAGLIKIDRFITDVKASDYDAVIIPGGAWSPDFLRNNKNVLTFVQEMNDTKKPIASICHGPWVLINAKVVKGRKMTASWNIFEDLKNAGAIVKNKALVVDGNIMTSRYPTDLAQIISETVRQIKK